jgi:GntR family transcriptional regulator, histidine utilization repressor
MTVAAVIRGEIESRIRSGEWTPGHRIPFEHELVERYGCSRATVSKALTGLAASGLIVRRRKAGSFVAHPQGEAAVLDIPDIAAVVAARGGGYRFELLDRQLLAARADPGFSARETLLYLSGVHHAEDGPFALEGRRISLTAVPQAIDVDFGAQAPGEWLIEHVLWSEASHRIAAVSASPVEARSLEIKSGSPCLQLDRTTWREGQTITTVRQLFPGDRHELTAHFTPRSG